jgi:hypothetical protein
MNPKWGNLQGRLSLVSGKQLLARLSAWTQATYGLALSAARIVRGMRRSEISDEIVMVHTAI